MHKSIELNGIGARMRAIRLEKEFSQSKMAAKLDIADRTYKYYEVEKREIPLSIALKFCKLFDRELTWLATGNGPQKRLDDADLLVVAVEATLTKLGKRSRKLSPSVLSKQVRYVYDQAATKGEDPWDVAETLVGLLPE